MKLYKMLCCFAVCGMCQYSFATQNVASMRSINGFGKNSTLGGVLSDENMQSNNSENVLSDENVQNNNNALVANNVEQSISNDLFGLHIMKYVYYKIVKPNNWNCCVSKKNKDYQNRLYDAVFYGDFSKEEQKFFQNISTALDSLEKNILAENARHTSNAFNSVISALNDNAIVFPDKGKKLIKKTMIFCKARYMLFLSKVSHRGTAKNKTDEQENLLEDQYLKIKMDARKIIEESKTQKKDVKKEFKKISDSIKLDIDIVCGLANIDFMFGNIINFNLQSLPDVFGPNGAPDPAV